MRFLVALLFGCPSPDDPRPAYEETFPERYCAWLETCPDDDGSGYGLDDCVEHFTRVMDAEREMHECFDERDAEECLRQLDPADERHEVCVDPQRVRPRPTWCWGVTWMAPCNIPPEE